MPFQMSPALRNTLLAVSFHHSVKQIVAGFTISLEAHPKTVIRKALAVHLLVEGCNMKTLKVGLYAMSGMVRCYE